MYHPAARSTQDSSSFQLDCTALTQAPVLKLQYQYSLFHTICKALYVSEVSDVQVISCSQDGDACPRTLHFLEFAIPGLNAVIDWGSNAWGRVYFCCCILGDQCLEEGTPLLLVLRQLLVFPYQFAVGRKKLSSRSFPAGLKARKTGKIKLFVPLISITPFPLELLTKCCWTTAGKRSHKSIYLISLSPD